MIIELKSQSSNEKAESLPGESIQEESIVYPVECSGSYNASLDLSDYPESSEYSRETVDTTARKKPNPGEPDSNQFSADHEVIFPRVNLIAYTPNPEKVIAYAAKLCYSDSDPTKLWNSLTDDEIEKFLDKIRGFGHMSPIEHASFTFLIVDVSRSFLAQITRHRIASFSVQSQRYVDFKNFRFLLPSKVHQSPESTSIAQTVMKDISTDYAKIHNIIVSNAVKDYVFDHFDSLWDDCDDVKTVDFIEESQGAQKKVIVTIHKDFFDKETRDYKFNRINELGDICQIQDIEKVAKILVRLFSSKDPAIKAMYSKADKEANESARAILPNACVCNMVVTMNCRELLHFFDLRCCNRAQEEIQYIAWQMLGIVKPLAPHIFAEAGPSCIRGKCQEGNMSCGKPFKGNEIEI